MDKLTDAMDHLNPDLVSDISVEFPKDESIDEEDICTNTKPKPSNIISCLFLLEQYYK